MNHWKIASFIGFALFCTIGCGKSGPPGLPALFSAKVVVKNGETPIANAVIGLTPIGGSGTSGSWNLSGVTGKDGVAAISISQGDWSSQGVPEGEYKVSVTKAPAYTPEALPEKLEGDEAGKMAFYAEQKKKMEAAPKEVPASLGTEKTPLTMKVVSGTPAELVVNVAEHKD